MIKIAAKLVKKLRDITSVGMMDAKKALIESEGDIQSAIHLLRQKGVAKAAQRKERIAAEGLCMISIKDNTAAIIEINSETDFVSKNSIFQDTVKSIAETIAINNPLNMEEALELEISKKKIKTVLNDMNQIMGEKISFRRFKIIKKGGNDVFGSYLHMGGCIASLVILEGTNNEYVAKDIAMHVTATSPKYLNEEQIPKEAAEKEAAILTEQALNEGKSNKIIKKIVDGRLKKFKSENSLLNQPFVKNSDLSVEQYVSSNGGIIKFFLRFEVGEGIEKKKENFAEAVINQVKK